MKNSENINTLSYTPLHNENIFRRVLLVETYSPLFFKSEQFLEAGYIYAPYIPVQNTATIFDPNNFEPKQGLMTRYAEKVVNSKFYGVVNLG